MTNWTASDLDRAKKLYADGYTGAQIANLFGGLFTRNAVIGKLHRSKGVTKTKLRVPKVPTVRNMATKKHSFPKIETTSPDSLKLSVTQLTLQTCKWGIGDVFDEDFHFCGCQTKTGSSWCEFHHAKAYQPLRAATVGEQKAHIGIKAA